MEQSPNYIAQRRTKFVVSKRPYIDSSRVQERDLKSSALPFLVLIFTGVTQITLFSFGAQSLTS